MCFPTHPFPASDQLFPRHDQVLSYLCSYATDLLPMIHLNTHVVSVTPASPGWTVTTVSPPSAPKTAHYDAIVVATGHYNTPHIPDIPGLTSFPAKLTHSRNFRRAEDHTGETVLLIGNSASAVDIAVQLLPVVKKLHQVILTAGPVPPPAEIVVHLGISRFLPTGEVEFVDGSRISGVDTVLFATGYLYTLPFLPLPLAKGEKVSGLFEHVFYAADPTLAFVGLATRVIPFPLVQSQGVWIAGVFSGRLQLPGNMPVEEKGHFFGFPKDYEYMRLMEGYCGDGGGMQPARWREWECWVRKRTVEIKQAFGEAKKRGLVARDMEELGFVYGPEERGKL